MRAWTRIHVIETERGSLVYVLIIFLSRVHEVLVLVAAGELSRRRLLVYAGATALLALLHGHVHHFKLIVWRQGRVGHSCEVLRLLVAANWLFILGF